MFLIKTQETRDPDRRVVQVMLDCSLTGEDTVIRAVGLGRSHVFVEGEKDEGWGESRGLASPIYVDEGD